MSTTRRSQGPGSCSPATYSTATPKTKVLLYNTQTHALRTLGSDSGRYRYVYSGQVNGDYAAWGRVRPGGPDVYLYRISTQTNTTIPRPVHDQYNPSVAADGTIYYFRSGNECGAFRSSSSAIRWAACDRPVQLPGGRRRRISIRGRASRWKPAHLLRPVQLQELPLGHPQGDRQPHDPSFQGRHRYGYVTSDPTGIDLRDELPSRFPRRCHRDADRNTR